MYRYPKQLCFLGDKLYIYVCVLYIFQVPFVFLPSSEFFSPLAFEEAKVSFARVYLGVLISDLWFALIGFLSPGS